MSDKQTGGPAFPVADPFAVHQPRNVLEAQRLAEGMSLRDYLAAKAMHATLSTITDFPDETWRIGVAIDSYAMADAMLKAREQ